MALFAVISLFNYPLEPAQISLVSLFTIGIPGFMLALEPNKDRIKGHFLKNVMLKALPGGLTDVIAVAALVIFAAESMFRYLSMLIDTVFRRYKNR